MKNRHIYHSRISEAKFREIVKLFSMDLKATQTAELTGASRNTITSLYFAMRHRIAKYSEVSTPNKR
ncbi:hypothetical protein FACS189499_05050 [Clostridia bacterium]|nr:hypothetical protein FACS189499_05050 [Clostridia bacterium]